MPQRAQMTDKQLEKRKAVMEAQDAAVREELKGFKNKLLVMSGKGIPLKYLTNMEVISIESLFGDKDTATIWRGP